MLIRLPLPPTSNHHLTPTKSGRMIKTKEHADYVLAASWMVRKQIGLMSPLEGPVALKVIIHWPKRVRVRDYDNRLKLLLDALKRGGLVVDDSQIRPSVRSADDPWEWKLSGPGYVELPHVVTVELGEPK